MAEPEKKALGRPLTLTPEVEAVFIALVKAGNFRCIAADAAGIPQRTMHRWLKRGERECDGPYHTFWQATLKAEAEAEIALVRTILMASAEDPNHAKFWLTQKHPDRWGSHAGEIKALKNEVSELKDLVREMLRGRNDPQ